MKTLRRAGVEAFDFEGLKIRDLTSALPAASASIAHIEVKPGAEHLTARSTKSDKYYVCVRGAVRFVVEGEPASLSIGDLLIVERGEWFSYCNPDPDPAELLLIHVPPFELDHEEFASESEER